MGIKKGDRVTIEYVGTLDDGTVFDSSKTSNTPIQFTIGSGEVISGFDDAVIDMNTNEEKTVVILSKDAYGESDPKMVMHVPRNQLPFEQEPKVGMMFATHLPNGAEVPVKVLAVSKNDVTLDLNHPLAGKTLHFAIKVLKIT